MTAGLTMQAVFSREGRAPADRLVIEEVERPTPQPGEVLVAVAAAGVNRADLLQRDGRYRLPRRLLGAPIGLEVSGTVVEVGPGVTTVAVDDEVCALLQGGGYAEYACIDAELTMPVPRGVSLHDAAGIPEVWATALDAVIRKGCLSPGESVLIHGGASGVGTAAIQIARSHDAVIYTTVGLDEKGEMVRDLGASQVFNYTSDSLWEELADCLGKRGLDLIVDIVGASYLEPHVRSLALDGRLVVLGLIGGKEATLDLGALLGKRLQLRGTTLRFRTRGYRVNLLRSLVKEAWPKFEQGEFRPIIDSVFGMGDVAAAHDRVSSSDHVGKVLLTW